MAEKPSSPDTPCGSAVPGSSAAFTIVLLYACFASLWILLSDKAVSLIFHDPATITLVSTLKGWFFVGITSLLLYILVRRLLHQTGVMFSPVATLRPLLLPTVLIALVIIAMTAGAISHTINNHKDKETARLQTVADLKTRQIRDWMAERMGDALFVHTSIYFAENYARWRDSGDQVARKSLLDRLDSFRATKSFQAIQLLDQHGNTLWSSEGIPASADPILKETAKKAAADQQIVHVGPYRDSHGHLHLDFIAQLPSVRGIPGPVVVLHTNPADYLYSTLQTWPVPSSSGETLLFRRDGDDVLFLNELRHQPGSALNLRRPVSQRDLPAAMVLRGEAGLNQPVQGSDYRGVPVLIVARAVEGTDWFLVAKMDRDEIFAESTRDAAWISLAGLLALFIIASGGILFRQRQHLLSSLRDRATQAENLRVLQLLEAIANSSTDAIFAKDQNGRYILFNRAAAAVTGTTPETVLGHDDTLLFPPEQAALVMAHDREVMESDRAMTFQENLETPEGEVTFLATKGPLRSEDGSIIGIFGISRNITERKQAEWEREVTVEFLSLINECGSEAELVRNSLLFFQKQSGCEAVGIRMKEGDDYPYYETHGFPAEFIASEDSLCEKDSSGAMVRDQIGNPVLACMCGNVIEGRFDPSKPFFTSKGSFWSNHTTKLLAATTDADRQTRTRNRCNGEGYESVALIALTVGDSRLGLLQLNDRRTNRFSPELVALWERLAGYLAVALAKFHAERLLRDSEQTYRSLFDNMLNGFAYCRMLYEDGKPYDFVYHSVNNAFSKLTGLKNVVGKKVSEVIPGIQKSDPELLALYGRVASTGTPERVEIHVAALHMWFSLSVYCPKQDHFVAIFDVITERKQAEQALKESEARLHLALKSANMGVWEWDVQTDEVIWSPECYELFGLTAFGGHLSDFTPMIHPDDLQPVLAAAEQAVQERSMYIVEFRVTRPDSVMLWVTNFARADYDPSGKPLRLVGIVQDITRRKLMEEERSTLQEQLLQAQKMESVGRLAGGVAHDFNNMLAVIFIAIELIKMKLSPDDPLNEHLHEIMSAATRARDITRQLLAFSRKQVIAPQVLDLNEFIAHSEKTLSRLIGEDIALSFIPGNPLGKIRVDPSQIDQVLMNLAANGRDAMPEGGNLTIETANVEFDEDYCRVHAGCRPGRYVQLTVTDDGIGMSEEVREHVFEPFFTTKEVGKGTGLGLATIYGIMQQNHGCIYVYSEPGFGTTFRLSFPRIDHEFPAPSPAAKEMLVRGEGSILLVEDDEILCRVTKATLENLGYGVTAAQSPEEALRFAEDQSLHFDLLLTDVVMPGMNGQQLRDRIVEMRPHLKVLFMSGYPSDVITKRGVLDGNVQFIPKPFAVDALAAKLKEMLPQR